MDRLGRRRPHRPGVAGQRAQDVAVLHGHTGSVIEVAFAPDGRRLASLSRRSPFVMGGDDTVRIWDVDPQATLPVLRGPHQLHLPGGL